MTGDRTQPAPLPTDLVEVRAALVEWYDSHHRPLPWRETTDPYAILVAEVMSQQTQLERVIEPWHQFLDRWPTVEELAGADRGAVVGFWTEHALGYNSRARYLHEAATQIVEEYGGSFPQDPDALQTLMGVGPYTANAVASFAFNAGNAVVDTNVRRILHRAFDVQDTDASYEHAAAALMPPDESRTWNNAIMELGGLACRPSPRCDDASCPWRPWCHAYQTGDFTAPDVPTQPTFEGSRRQMRGRIVATLREHGELDVDVLGAHIREDYTPDGTDGREWLHDLLEDLADDGLVTLNETGAVASARLGK